MTPSLAFVPFVVGVLGAAVERPRAAGAILGGRGWPQRELGIERLISSPTDLARVPCTGDAPTLDRGGNDERWILGRRAASQEEEAPQCRERES